MRHVHVVVSDKGWILERLAKELAERLSNVTYGLHADPRAALQYYVTYGARLQRTTQKEAALFTHLEDDQNARAKFFEVAKNVDCAVAMSKAAAQPLLEAGLEHVEIISPGVDVDRYYPITRIGVVGRTYHTGRKGEGLINELPQIDGIEFVFTGDGWPGPAQHVPDAEMPDFYRGLDYVLVPALNEGGPMCVLEALSCGVPIIGSDVGWITDYPHIPFETGKVASLRKVLQELRDKKLRLRRSVESRTWDAWAEGHERLFGRLLGTKPRLLLRKKSLAKGRRQQLSARLLTHGSEGHTQGGPSIRVPRTVAALRKLGIDAHAGVFPSADALGGDLVHLFNVWTPETAVSAARLAKAAGKSLVFSPILLDLSEIGFWTNELMERIVSEGVNDEMLDRLMRDYKSRRGWAPGGSPEAGFKSRLTELAELSDRVIFLSEYERSLFRRVARIEPASTIVRNPVDSNAFAAADPELFRNHVGLTEFILCVARLEPRKNQLLLLRAAKELGLPVVLVGHSGSDWYGRALRDYATDQVRFIGRLDPNSELLRSAFAACRVFALPSWAEGAPLAALEAAAAGANLVLSSRSSEREYFGEFARYADPSNCEELKHALHQAWFDPERSARAEGLRRLVASEHTWEVYAQRTADVYKKTLEQTSRLSTPPATAEQLPYVTDQGARKIVMDVTTSLHHSGLISGITRVEGALSEALIGDGNVSVRFVAWNQGLRRFIEIPATVVRSGSVRSFVEMGVSPVRSSPLPRDASLIVVGSGWMQNGVYAEGLSQFAAEQNLALNIVIHDLTPVYWSHWYPKGYSPVFVENLKTLLRTSDRLLTYSDSTTRDVIRFAAESAISCPPIAKFKLASEIDDTSSQQSSFEDRYGDRAFARSPFILVVGAIHRRKNYELLYDCWLQLKRSLGDGCPHLVIVGGVSWNGAELARALTEDRDIANLVHILTGVDDHSLAALYEHCLFTVYPSLYEGWGLPVAESLARGKICLASNTSSVPEIAPELTDLLDPTDRRAWTARIIHYLTSTTSRAAREKRIRAAFSVVSWSESAAALTLALAAERSKQSDRFLYNLGSVCDLARSDSSHKLLGWYSCETFGSWASSTNSVLRFDLRPFPSEDLLFAVSLRAFCPPAENSAVTVFANSVEVVSWDVPAGTNVVRFGRIPRSALGDDGRLDLRFRTARTEYVRRVHPGSGDLRDLGIAVSQVQIVNRSSVEDLVLTGMLPEAASVFQLTHSAANDELTVGSHEGTRLQLPGLLTHSEPSVVIAADCVDHDGFGSNAVVMLNGQLVGEMPRKMSLNRLHFFQVPAAVAALHDPAFLEIIPTGTRLKVDEERKINVLGADVISSRAAHQFVPANSGTLDLTDARVQMRVAGALTNGGGAYPSGVRLGHSCTMEFTVEQHDGSVLLIRTVDPAALGINAEITTLFNETLSQPQACSDGLNVINVPAGENARIRLRNATFSEEGPLIQSIESRRLIALCGGQVSLGDEDPDYVIADGFHPPEDNEWWSGRWTNSAQSFLCFRNSDLDVDRIQLDLEAGFVCPEAGLRVTISVNDQQRVDLVLSEIGPVSCDIEAALSPGAICKLKIEVDRTFVPIEHGFPGDDRVLGIFIRSVRCIEKSQIADGPPVLRIA